MVRRPSAEQEELRRTVRSFLADGSSEARVREVMESEDGHDKALWEQFAGQLGVLGLLVPEELGGSGATAVEAAIVLEETGRALACIPYLSSAVLAVTLLLESGDDAACQDYLPGIADGSTVAAVAIAEPPAVWGHEGERMRTAATRTASGWRLSGEKAYVLDGGIADLLLVAATTGVGPAVFAVQPDADGLVVVPMRTADGTRRLSAATLAAVPGRLVGTEDAAGPVARMLDMASVALVAEDVGGAQRIVELSADYAGLRKQFGRVIGANQAVKQKLADMVTSVELARAAARRVAEAAAADRAVLPMEASMAKALCSDAYVQAAYDTIQVHGGVGFTWEHPAHLYFRRAIGNAQLFGSPDRHRELAARHLLD